MPVDDIKIRIATWQADREILAQIRRTVFIEEQNVPEALEWDEYDATATHFLVLDNNRVIATARLKPDGQIGRMAVLAAYRKRGVGSRLLNYVLQVAAQQNHRQIFLHAQTTAIAFYEKHGFKTYGELFDDANIPHQSMLLNFSK